MFAQNIDLKQMIYPQIMIIMFCVPILANTVDARRIFLVREKIIVLYGLMELRVLQIFNYFYYQFYLRMF